MINGPKGTALSIQKQASVADNPVGGSEGVPRRCPPCAPVIIAVIPKNPREQVRIALDEFRGHRLVDIRVAAELTASSGVFFPTKRGVSLNVAMLPGLVRALRDAEDKARELGLIGGKP